jgi:hypothetical protein
VAFGSIFTEAWNHAAAVGNPTKWVQDSFMYEIYKMCCCSVYVPCLYPNVINCGVISDADSTKKEAGIYKYKIMTS